MLLFGKNWLRRNATQSRACRDLKLCKQTIYSENKYKNVVYLIEWFEDQAEFTTAFECMSTEEMNKCISKFYVSARKHARRKLLQKTSLLSILKSSA